MDKDIKKRCCICGDDVSRKKRTRDADSRYYCQPCFENARRANNQDQARDSEGVEDESEVVVAEQISGSFLPESFSCPKCSGYVAKEWMDASGVCIKCARLGSNQKLVSTQALSKPRSKSASIVSRISVMVLCLFIFVGVGFGILRLQKLDQPVGELALPDDKGSLGSHLDAVQSMIPKPVLTSVTSAPAVSGGIDLPSTSSNGTVARDQDSKLPLDKTTRDKLAFGWMQVSEGEDGIATANDRIARDRILGINDEADAKLKLQMIQIEQDGLQALAGHSAEELRATAALVLEMPDASEIGKAKIREILTKQ